jgi:hypothetical protein
MVRGPGAPSILRSLWSFLLSIHRDLADSALSPLHLVRACTGKTVPTSESTCWTMIRAAAAGSAADREELARRYLAIVRSYLAARWRGTTLRADLDDATQAVFVECLRFPEILSVFRFFFGRKSAQC